jgi:phenylalanyl-tRNA synthetase beta chain
VLYRDVISFPPLRQDIAVVVDEDVPAGRVVGVVRAAAGPELAAVDVFDVYRKPPVPEGRKSLALHLVFQATDRTLTDAEADAVRERVVAALADQVGGDLRA